MNSEEKKLIQRGAKLTTRGNFNLFLINAGLDAARSIIAAEKEAKEAKESVRRQVDPASLRHQQEATQ
jgi:uncharacterized protein (DUF1778 family)